ncbi:MAG: hypothetical protein ACLKAK_06395 [Alkaliphilus sp.]
MKKIKILALVLVLAFAAMGGAYAIWQDTLFASETITTGTFDVQWVLAADESDRGSDTGENYQLSGSVYSHETEREALDNDNPNDAKNVASKNIEYGAKDDNREIVMTLANAYPGYQAYVEVEIHNFGTVPAKFTTANLVTKVYDWVNGAWVQNNDTHIDWMQVDTTVYTSAGDEVTNADADAGYQLNPNDYFTLRFNQRVLNNAPENTKVVITVEAIAIQWNAWSSDGSWTLPSSIQDRP